MQKSAFLRLSVADGDGEEGRGFGKEKEKGEGAGRGGHTRIIPPDRRPGSSRQTGNQQSHKHRYPQQSRLGRCIPSYTLKVNGDVVLSHCKRSIAADFEPGASHDASVLEDSVRHDCLFGIFVLQANEREEEGAKYGKEGNDRGAVPGILYASPLQGYQERSDARHDHKSSRQI